MDMTKVAIGGLVTLVALAALGLGYKFLVDHWEDIQTLAILALILGGTITLAFGGWRLLAGR